MRFELKVKKFPSLIKTACFFLICLAVHLPGETALSMEKDCPGWLSLSQLSTRQEYGLIEKLLDGVSLKKRDAKIDSDAIEFIRLHGRTIQIDGLTAKELKIDRGQAKFNKGIYFVKRGNEPHVIKVDKLAQSFEGREATGFLWDLRGYLIGELLGGAKIYNFGTIEGSNDFYFEMSELFPSEPRTTFKDLVARRSTLGSIVGDPQNRTAIASKIAEMFAKFYSLRIFPWDIDLMIAASGNVAPLDTTYWRPAQSLDEIHEVLESFLGNISTLDVDFKKTFTRRFKELISRSTDLNSAEIAKILSLLTKNSSELSPLF